MKPRLAAAPSLGGLVLAAAAGALQALSIAWPGTGQAHGWLQILSLALLSSSLARLAFPRGSGDLAAIPERALLTTAAQRTAVFAVFWLAGVFWWLHVSMHQVGGMPAPLSAAAVLLLASALGLYYVGAATLWVLLVRRAQWDRRPLAASVLFAALWLLAELMRGRWFTGFPWGAGGYAHLDGWLAPAAPWVGVYGMGALAAGLAMRIALLRTWPQRRVRALLGMALVLAGVAHLPDAERFTRPAGTAEVELLQGNIAQSDKFEAGRGIRDALVWYAERLTATIAVNGVGMATEERRGLPDAQVAIAEAVLLNPRQRVDEARDELLFTVRAVPPFVLEDLKQQARRRR